MRQWPKQKPGYLYECAADNRCRLSRNCTHYGWCSLGKDLKCIDKSAMDKTTIVNGKEHFDQDRQCSGMSQICSEFACAEKSFDNGPRVARYGLCLPPTTPACRFAIQSETKYVPPWRFEPH